MIETDTASRSVSPEVFTTLQKVDRFALSDPRFSNLRGDLHSIAVQKAAFFLDASEEVVHQRARVLYQKELAEKRLREMDPPVQGEQHASYLANIYGKFGYDSFERKEKEIWAGGFYEMYDYYLDNRQGDLKMGLAKWEANESWQSDFRIEIARREARSEFAKALQYTPGDRQKDAYDGITSNKDFIRANDLLTEVMQKFVKFVNPT